VLLRRGLILLVPECIVVLGGSVESLKQRQLEAMAALAKRLGLSNLRPLHMHSARCFQILTAPKSKSYESSIRSKTRFVV